MSYSYPDCQSSFACFFFLALPEATVREKKTYSLIFLHSLSCVMSSCGATNISEIVRRKREFSANIYSLTLPLCRQFWSYSRRHHLMSAWLSVDLLQVHTHIHTQTNTQDLPIFSQLCLCSAGVLPSIEQLIGTWVMPPLLNQHQEQWMYVSDTEHPDFIRM